MIEIIKYSIILIMASPFLLMVLATALSTLKSLFEKRQCSKREIELAAEVERLKEKYADPIRIEKENEQLKQELADKKTEYDKLKADHIMLRAKYDMAIKTSTAGFALEMQFKERLADEVEKAVEPYRDKLANLKNIAYRLDDNNRQLEEQISKLSPFGTEESIERINQVLRNKQVSSILSRAVENGAIKNAFEKNNSKLKIISIDYAPPTACVCSEHNDGSFINRTVTLEKCGCESFQKGHNNPCKHIAYFALYLSVLGQNTDCLSSVFGKEKKDNKRQQKAKSE